MNIKEYIESGIIESYVLGLATEVEQQEFESLCAQYPEIVQAKHAFELALEVQLIKEGVKPPAGLKEKIFRSLNSPGIDNSSKKEEASTTFVRKMNVWKLVAVIFIFLLAVTFYYTYSISDKHQKLQRVNNELKNQLEDSNKANPIMALNPIAKSPSIKWSAMIEPTNASHCMAHIYWDTLSKDTYLLVGNITNPVSHKQFQLWALLDNEPVDLGVFDITKEGQVLQMKDLYKAKAFIITLEPRGGSATPTMEAVYATGKL